MLALLSALPQVSQAGLYTNPLNPTYNVGPESAVMNPAGMTGVKSFAATMGVGGVIPVAKFKTDVAGAGGDDGGNSGVNSVLPSLFVVAPITDDFRLGLSAFSPLGGPDGLGWDFGENFAGRYGSEGLTFASTAVALSLAYKVTDKLSIGGGAGAQWLSINASMALRTPFQGDGKARLNDLDDWGVRYFFGLQYQLTPATSFGMVYRSKWEANTKGNLVVSGLPVNLPTTDFELDLVLPQEVEIGIQHAFSKTWILGLTFDWQNWDQFKNMDVGFEFTNGVVKSTVADLKWHDTYSTGISLTHIMGGGATFLNLGFTYSSSPVDDADRIILLPVDESWTLSLGVAHNVTKDLTASLGGAVVFSGSGKVDNIDQGVQFSGKFDTNVAIALGGSVQWRF